MQRPQPARPRRFLGNRDWTIVIECTAEGAFLRPAGRRFSLADLAAPGPQQGSLVQAVRQLIDRRQASVPPGELPYRPMIRFVVHEGGLRAYHTAFPLLEELAIPLTRENAAAEVHP